MKLEIDHVNKKAKLIGVNLNNEGSEQPNANVVYTLHIKVIAK